MTLTSFIETAATNHDNETILKVQMLARQLGRAVALSCVSAIAGPEVEDEAMAAMDKAWVELIDEAMLLVLDAKFLESRSANA